MTNRTILVDVDLTVVDSGTPWRDWLNEATGAQLDPYTDTGEINYDLSVYWGDYLKGSGIDPYDYWRSETLYDNSEPLEGAVECLRGFSEAGWGVVFVSALKGNHHKSKYHFLKRNFPFMAGFIGTREKQFVRGDILIDDRNKFLNMMPEGCHPIRFKTVYTQEVSLREKVGFISNWNTFDTQSKSWR